MLPWQLFLALYRWGAHWRHLKNTTEPSMCGGDAALCQITLTTCSNCGYRVRTCLIFRTPYAMGALTPRDVGCNFLTPNSPPALCFILCILRCVYNLLLAYLSQTVLVS